MRASHPLAVPASKKWDGEAREARGKLGFGGLPQKNFGPYPLNHQKMPFSKAG